jgi:hypothetical protein
MVEFFGVPRSKPIAERHALTASARLVWAGRMQARLGPQLNLAQELAAEIKPFLHQRPSVIRVHASHGFAVSKLREPPTRNGISGRQQQNSLVARRRAPTISAFISREGMRAKHQACRDWLDPREDRVISFVTRRKWD